MDNIVKFVHENNKSREFAVAVTRFTQRYSVHDWVLPIITSLWDAQRDWSRVSILKYDSLVLMYYINVHAVILSVKIDVPNIWNKDEACLRRFRWRWCAKKEAFHLTYYCRRRRRRRGRCCCYCCYCHCVCFFVLSPFALVSTSVPLGDSFGCLYRFTMPHSSTVLIYHFYLRWWLFWPVLHTQVPYETCSIAHHQFNFTAHFSVWVFSLLFFFCFSPLFIFLCA